MPDAATASDPQTPQAESTPPRNAKASLASRAWTWFLVLLTLAGSALVAFAFLLPDLDRTPLALGETPDFSRRLGSALTWVAFCVRTFDLLGAVILSLLCVLIVARRRWVTAAIAMAAVGVLIAPVVMRVIDRPPVPSLASDAPRLTVASLNTLGDAAKSDALRAFLESVDPDVIVLIEYEQGIDAREREWLRSRWPYFAAAPRDDRFGMAMYSRLKFVDRPEVMPLLEIPAANGSSARVSLVDPQIRAVVRVGEQDIVIQGVHPLPPGSFANLAEQREVHRALAHWGATDPRPKVIIGDFNATPRAQSTAWFNDAGLFDARDPAETIDQRTWPSGLGIPLFFGVRIDRALASQQLQCERFIVGPANGSDHLPIAVRFVLKPEN